MMKLIKIVKTAEGSAADKTPAYAATKTVGCGDNCACRGNSAPANASMNVPKITGDVTRDSYLALARSLPIDLVTAVLVTAASDWYTEEDTPRARAFDEVLEGIQQLTQEEEDAACAVDEAVDADQAANFFTQDPELQEYLARLGIQIVAQ